MDFFIGLFVIGFFLAVLILIVVLVVQGSTTRRELRQQNQRLEWLAEQAKRDPRILSNQAKAQPMQQPVAPLQTVPSQPQSRPQPVVFRQSQPVAQPVLQPQSQTATQAAPQPPQPVAQPMPQPQPVAFQSRPLSQPIGHS
ncbi:MAG: hypothetical protein LBP28_07125, partial [Coriobacteriales bacterium]|nr:hypothetical protein [Coriobacteriales bacterium]